MFCLAISVHHITILTTGLTQLLSTYVLSVSAYLQAMKDGLPNKTTTGKGGLHADQILPSKTVLIRLTFKKTSDTYYCIFCPTLIIKVFYNKLI